MKNGYYLKLEESEHASSRQQLSIIPLTFGDRLVLASAQAILVLGPCTGPAVFSGPGIRGPGPAIRRKFAGSGIPGPQQLAR